jgi:hypothetical protein
LNFNKPTSVSSFLPVNAAATIVDGATAPVVGGQLYFSQWNYVLPTTVVGVITGLDNALTYNVQIFDTANVAGGTCANTGNVFTVYAVSYCR